MDDLFSIRFSYEQEMKDEVIAVFSNKQGGDYNVFAYYWQCFAWAATIGFLKCEPLPLTKKIADKPFSLNTMIANGGDNTANALISMCIAKAGTLDILKDPNDAINLINEYANAGFHKILEEMKNNPVFNDLEWVKQEIFSREV